jgi:hypothetical protein
MAERTSATERRGSRGRAVALGLLGTAAAFVTAWLLGEGFCLLAARLGMHLPSFTCGRNFGLPFLLFFVTFWPMYVFTWPILFRKTRQGAV